MVATISAIPQDQIIKLHEVTTAEFVLCHNNLSQHNDIVDETTLEVKACEYAAFYPPEFEEAFYLRPGPSVALGEEVNVIRDTRALEGPRKRNVS